MSGIALVLVLATMPSAAAEQAGGHLNVGGAILLMAASLGFRLPLSTGGTWGWDSIETLSIFAAAAVALLTRVVCERR